MHKDENSNADETQLLASLPPQLREQIQKIPLDWCRKILISNALKGEEIPFPWLKPIEYSYRPRSYWEEENLLQLIANIKGAERKKDARRLLKQGRLDEAYDFILRDTLDEHLRGFLGSLHPTLLGGEFLPDYKPQEIEIARITMDSTTQDVISIRASPGTLEQPIIYRVFDEYGSHFNFEPQFSQLPLTLEELIRLIDTSSGTMGGIGLDIIQTNLDCSEDPPETYANFLDFSSEFYAGLDRHYWFAVRRWVDENSKPPRPPKTIGEKLP